jgi:hypothetical protein
MVTRLVVIHIVKMRGAMMMRRSAMARMLTTMFGRCEVLVHHCSAVLVPHDLLVSHAVALTDRPL